MWSLDQGLGPLVVRFAGRVVRSVLEGKGRTGGKKKSGGGLDMLR